MLSNSCKTLLTTTPIVTCIDFDSTFDHKIDVSNTGSESFTDSEIRGERGRYILCVSHSEEQFVMTEK